MGQRKFEEYGSCGKEKKKKSSIVVDGLTFLLVIKMWDCEVNWNKWFTVMSPLI